MYAGPAWLTFETIDNATRRPSTAAPASVGGSKHSGEDGGYDVLYVKTTTTSSLSMMAPLMKRKSPTSPLPGPDILIQAPAAIDYQPKESLEDGYESDKDLQAPVFKQKSRLQASTDESDSESESGYAIDEGDII